MTSACVLFVSFLSRCFMSCVPLDPFLTGCDVCLEPKFLSAPPIGHFPCVCFAYRVLSYGKAEEVESHVSVHGFQCVGDSCFCWAHVQSHAFQPFCHLLCCLVHCFSLGVEDDEVISIPYQDRQFVCRP